MQNFKDTWPALWQATPGKPTHLVRNDKTNFCMELQIQPNQTLPANEKLLIYFATYMARFVKADTIKVYLAAIRYLHIINGYNLNLQSFLRLQYVIKGIKHSQGGPNGPAFLLPISGFPAIIIKTDV